MQARYIVERMDSDLWNKVLDENNQYRRQLIDQVSFGGLMCKVKPSCMLMINAAPAKLAVLLLHSYWYLPLTQWLADARPSGQPSLSALLLMQCCFTCLCNVLLCDSHTGLQTGLQAVL